MSVAVLACAFSSFVAPPQAQARLQFSTFDKPVKARTVQQQAWLNTPFVLPQAPFAGFSEFGRPGQTQSTSAARRAGWTFAPTQPASVPFSGFFDFGTARANRINSFDAVQTVSIDFEIAPQLIPAAGGTSRKLPLPEVHAKKHRTGFEPIKKVHAPPEAIRTQPIPLPPFKLPRAPEPIATPPVIVDPNLIPKDLLGLQDQIRTAQDISDILDVLKLIEGTDEQS